MKITFLGTGDMFSVEQHHNSMLTEFGGTHLVIDFPESNAKALKEVGFPMTDIHNVFITHLHEDHINGVQMLGYYSQIVGDRKPRLFIHEQLVEPLWSILSPGMRYTTDGERTMSDYYDIVPLSDGGTFELGGVTFETFRTQHVPGMVSNGILAKPYFYYSADSTLDQERVEQAAADVQLIFHECHMHDLVIKSHTSLKDLEQLPAEVRQKTVLMHYHDEYADASNRERFNREHDLRMAGTLESFELNEK
ncbi:MBL fold metallo-hydrolase [Paenibacillus sp. ACRRY]|uniref:MBL fold metallo-hydrolase n=1 Tax=Paenibacillus sp. ACRRY TaxID=2918208 RepID=UPI001EF6DC68|nr:MBL fold metallo-hydrolase [Paenibacillus sp. ACRRY]MCG7383884.1 MBL fold metallo-hydrolase [Paenibacillus sp. ACRRY]